ncbi:uncharacterized protein BDZ99DRAFT_461014 [Mytilinidion resinicola]|uniref:Uncharacterized protein n=1 Tax=Mytilinidion resinicola TaxID=574789 RepID=A0A6A6YU24_9PEZI|nr:uncharacterized protein BDZ99DRAFT_461014 [Mytilinidion resinicola]KAF2812281.1 hypothetical protein BDZ99DRAFT_461014 [Mytilinidion resinicola]
MSLKISAKTAEAQARAGLNSTEWKRFLAVTKQEAERLATDHPEWTRWTQVYADTQADIQERVVKQLLEEKIHKIDVDVVDWRMTQVVRKVHLARTPSHKEASKPTDRPHEQQPPTEQPLAPTKPTDRPHEQQPLDEQSMTSIKPTDRPHEQQPLAEQPLASSKPYDPVRESAVQNG